MNKDYRTLLDLFHEFDLFLRQIYGFYMDSVAGFDFLARHIDAEHEQYRKLLNDDKELSSTEFLDTLSFSHDSIVGGNLAKLSIYFGKKGDIRKRNRRDGSNQQYLGNMCLVMIFAYWETYFRDRLAKALGEKRVELTSPLWGDLRILRICILHKKHIQIEDIKKIQVLNWFETGDKVIINEAKFMRTFLCLLDFRNWIHEQSMPKKGIRIPLKR
jgi:hypothetical protein